jgi:hypothetical protein
LEPDRCFSMSRPRGEFTIGGEAPQPDGLLAMLAQVRRAAQFRLGSDRRFC